MTLKERIGSDLFQNEDLTERYDYNYRTVTKLFQNWTIRSGFPCGAVGGLVFVCFLKYLSDNRERLQIKSSDLYRYDILCSIFPEHIDVKELAEYVEDVERQIGFSVGVIAEFAHKINHQLVEEAFREALGIIREVDFSYRNGNGYGLAYELLLMEIERQGSNAKQGILVTGVSLAELMGELLDLRQGMSVYDPAGGFGILTAVATAGISVDVVTQEIVPDIAAVNEMLLIMSGCRKGKVLVGDSLADSSKNQERKYDRIICDLPILKKSLPVSKALWGSNMDGTWHFVFQIVDSLKENGRAVIWLPQSYSFRGGYFEKNRRFLLEQGVIEAIINIPDEYMVGSNAKFSIWIIQKRLIREGNWHDTVYMLDFTGRDFPMPEDLKADSIFERLAELVRRRYEIPEYAKNVEIKEIIRNESILSISRYMEMTVNIEEFLSQSASLYDREEKLEKELTGVSEAIRETLMEYENLRRQVE